MSTQDQTPVWGQTQKVILGALLLVQFVFAYALGTGHWLTNDGQSIIPPIAYTAFAPVALFIAVYALSTQFRRFVLAQDIRILTMMQHWRVIGLGFLLLYSHQVLPGFFAWPAGLGDVAVGLTAILIIARLDRDPTYATTSGFTWFHYAGLADFAVAVVTAGLAAGAYPGLIPDGVTTAAIDVWPLNIFPSFLVPAFIILHLTVLLNVRELRRSAAAQGNTSLQTA